MGSRVPRSQAGRLRGAFVYWTALSCLSYQWGDHSCGCRADRAQTLAPRTARPPCPGGLARQRWALLSPAPSRPGPLRDKKRPRFALHRVRCETDFPAARQVGLRGSPRPARTVECGGGGGGGDPTSVSSGSGAAERSRQCAPAPRPPLPPSLVHEKLAPKAAGKLVSKEAEPETRGFTGRH